MADMTTEQVKRLDMRQISRIFRETARKQRGHEAVTYEDGLDLVNIVAVHGDRLADAIGLFFHTEKAK
jgi:hypothetical protein